MRMKVEGKTIQLASGEIGIVAGLHEGFLKVRVPGVTRGVCRLVPVDKVRLSNHAAQLRHYLRVPSKAQVFHAV